MKDVMGQALLDYLHTKQPAEIIVESSIAEDDVIPVPYLFRSYEEMPELEKMALQNCNGRVLDIGAGAGSHALVLQELGFEVTALDVSKGAVEVMQARGVKDAVQADLWQWQPQKQFDTILLLMNGIGLAGTLEGLDALLVRLMSWLEPGGQVLLESSDILYMYEEEDGSVLIDLNGPYYGEVIYKMKYGDLETEEFNWLFIDPLTLEDRAVEAGFIFELMLEGEGNNYLAQLLKPEE